MTWPLRRPVAVRLTAACVAAVLSIASAVVALQLTHPAFASTPRLASPGSVVFSMEPPVTGQAAVPVTVSLVASAGMDRSAGEGSLVLETPSTNDPSTVVIVYLCGAVSEHPSFADNVGAPVKWNSVNKTHLLLNSAVGDVSKCKFARITVHSELGMHQNILHGNFGVSFGAVSGSKVSYDLPDIRTFPGFAMGSSDGSIDLPNGSTYSVSLTNPPPDLRVSVASPQLPDEGVLRWNGQFASHDVSGFRLSGVLEDRDSRAQRNLYIAGALIGFAGGAVLWLLQLVVELAISAGVSKKALAEPLPKAVEQVQKHASPSEGVSTARDEGTLDKEGESPADEN